MWTIVFAILIAEAVITFPLGAMREKVDAMPLVSTEAD